MVKIKVTLIAILFAFLFIQCETDRHTDELVWPKLKTENKPGTYWWWMGSAVDEKNLTYNLEALSNAGIGSVHIIPIYGVKGEEKKYINFLSPQWMKMLAYTTNETERLNMNTDMSTTTGWPFGGSHVSENEAASKIEFKKFILSENQNITKVFNSKKVESIAAYSKNTNSINLISKMDTSGKFSWKAPKGNWEVYVLLKSGTGQKVKRAAPGNIGLVLDPFSPGSLKKYLRRYDDAFTNYSGGKLRAQYHDSYEYYNATWTNDYLKIFKQKNGYDLEKYLPSIFDTNKINLHVKADYRRTLAELHLEYIEDWNSWSHQKGWITRNEAHGAPANLLDLYAASDIPETETFGSRKFKIPNLRYVEENNSTSMPPNPLILKFASSAAHVTGKILIASETGTWLRDHYKAALSQVKPEIDELFFCGINHIFYHGNAYSPKEAEWPGWIFYASTHFEKENNFWNDFSELNKYVTRCQSVLQSGKPSNDILLYWSVEDLYHSYPELLIKVFNVHKIDWFLESQFGNTATTLDKKGFSFDYISDKQLLNIEYSNNKLIASGNNYKTIIIPKTKHIPLKTLEHIKRLANNGATIIVLDELPNDVPGFYNLIDRREILKISLAELNFKKYSDSNSLVAEFGKGNVLLCKNIDEGLRFANVEAESIVSKGVNYIRRELEDGYYYFFTNLSDKELDSWVPLSVLFKSAAIFNPLLENSIGVAAVRDKNKSSEVYLQLKPGESCIVKTFTSISVKGKAWKYLKSNNNGIKITGNWKVDFIEGKPSLPKSYETSKLESWTLQNDEETKSFAGTGKYTITFNITSNDADNWVLNLGEVCETANVKLNGKYAGTLWSYPYSIRVGKYLKQGENILEIEVSNLSANRIRGLDKDGVDWKKFFFVNIFYKRFDATKWEIMDSGLLGPVVLTPQKFILNKKEN